MPQEAIKVETPPAEAPKETPESRHKIRRASIVDIEEIVDFLVGDDLDVQNNLHAFLPKDRSTVKTTFYNLLGPAQEGIVWVSTYTDKEGHDILTGILALRLEGVWWSKDRMLVNLVFYVNPHYRSYQLANRLLKIGVEFAEASGFPLVGSTFQFTNQVDALERYFKVKGFEKLGSLLIYTGGR